MIARLRIRLRAPADGRRRSPCPASSGAGPGFRINADRDRLRRLFIRQQVPTARKTQRRTRIDEAENGDGIEDPSEIERRPRQKKVCTRWRVTSGDSTSPPHVAACTSRA